MKYLIYVDVILTTHLTESWACISGFVHAFETLLIFWLALFILE